MNHFFYRILLALLFLGFSLALWAQPEPCEEPVMTPFCDSVSGSACVICDIDGFTGVNNGGSSGEAPPGFCTSTVHNGRWIAFIAGSESLTIRLSVANCQSGWGLELGIYAGNDCSNFQLVSNCDGSVNENTSAIFTTNAPLTIGQYYYIVMDGNNGDVCEWTFEVLEGSTQVNALTTSGIVSGELETCPSKLYEYVTTAELGATEFQWTVDGTVVQDNGSNVLEQRWQNDGTYELCVTAFNACDGAPQTCQTVEVVSPEPTLFDEKICIDESFVVNDTIELNTTGNYEFVYPAADGCDSTVLVDLEVIESTFTEVTANICEGDDIFIGDTPYFEAGQYTEVLQNVVSCDSTVTLNLSIIICEMEGTIGEIPVLCFGESSGQLNFEVTDGTPPFNYTWERLGGTQTGNGTLSNVNEMVNLSGLVSGTYLVTFNDAFGNDLILVEAVTEPPVLSAELVVSDFNGVNVSCFEALDGSLEILPSGGSLPYEYAWNTGNNTIAISDLPAGDYSVTITDKFDCNVVLSQTLTEPNPLDFNALFTHPNCDGLETGALQVLDVSGGRGAYLFDYSGNGFVTEQAFENLPEGTYTLTVQDENGCQADTTAAIIAPIIPVIDLGDDLQIFLGDEVTLDIESNISLEDILWSSEGELTCVDCPNPVIRPFDTTVYSVEVVSEDGCVTEDLVTVNVDKRRRVVVPTAFSPNQDGVNDYFGIAGGPEVSNIRSFQVFSRWGEEIFSEMDFLPNDSKFAWDGFYKFRPAQNGVYVWWAELEFIDGEVLVYQGTVTLLK